jgi:peptidase propeptide and YPEB domain protein
MAFKEGMFAKVSGQQAAAAAVAEVGGVVKDVDYKYKQHLGGRYKVEILKDGVEYEALVDAQNGKVLAVAQDDDQDKRHFGKHDKHHKHDNYDNAEPPSSQNTDYQAPADAAPDTPENATASEVTKS